MGASILGQVQAQETATKTLRRALATGRVHHAYLFEGPDGVGKELAAFGLAQALVCEARGVGEPPDEACGACSACTRAVPRKDEGGRAVHPDVVVLERGLYDPAQIGRKSPETQDLSIDQVRTLVLARAAFGPHEGKARVFIVRRAEEMSVSAQNALLKTLEEPGRATHFILVTSQPESLLATILSRTQRVRFAPLPESVIVAMLTADGLEAARAASIAGLASGSIETARLLADPERSADREGFVTRALAAIDASDFAPAMDLADEAKKSKDALPERLAALAEALAARARTAAADPDAHKRGAAVTLAVRHRAALNALRELEGNLAAQLVVESMFLRMRA
jgi:DNA polymerase-3 subunit delta'